MPGYGGRRNSTTATVEFAKNSYRVSDVSREIEQQHFAILGSLGRNI